VCAAYPGGEPNHVIDDLAAHLMLEHRTSNNDLISFLFTLHLAENCFYISATVRQCQRHCILMSSVHSSMRPFGMLFLQHFSNALIDFHQTSVKLRSVTKMIRLGCGVKRSKFKVIA